MQVTFAGRRLTVCYQNPGRLDYGSYRIGAAVCDGAELCAGSSGSLLIPRAMVEALPAAAEHRITVTLC